MSELKLSSNDEKPSDGYVTLHYRGREERFHLECIKVDKVFNACRLSICPVEPAPRIPIVLPAAAAFVSCEVRNVVAQGLIASQDRVVVNIAFDARTTFVDVNGIQRTTGFQTFRFIRGLELAGAVPNIGMVIQFEPDPPIVECLSGEVVAGGSAIELVVGICAILKISLEVQLEVVARQCPLPEPCEVLAEPCEDFLERCEDFLASRLVPPQPSRRGS